MILLLSALAGAVHVLAPDHWIPLSLKSWKERWNPLKSLGISSAVFGLHVAVGFLIYLGLEHLVRLDSSHFFWAVGIVCIAAAARSWRFSRLSEVLKPSAQPRDEWLRILLFVGPCESIVPIFLKARELGLGYLSVFGAFTLGTLIAGCFLVLVGPVFWNHPLRLSHLLRGPGQRKIALPVIAAVSVGLVMLLRLS
jgi:hypothetical protein